VRALARVAEEAQRERHTDQVLQPALVLLIDQFEELFAQGVSDQERTAFAESIRELVASGRVWCVGTLRADLYEFLLKQPVLKALKEAGASLDLGPPGAAELAEIVRAPASAAGLAIADYGYVMESGRVVFAQLMTHPDVREFYLGGAGQSESKSYRDIKQYRRKRRWWG
jgi:hypothetical protein